MFETIFEDYKNLSLALGFFDGLHLGHQRVLANTVQIAKQNGIKSAVITFNSHPAEYFKKNIKYISTIKQRDEYIYEQGIDYVFSLNFDKNLALMSCEDYLKNLIKKFSPISITTGFNHTFGYSKCGNPEFLRKNQVKYGYKYFEIPQMTFNNEVVSSSLIRQKLSLGEVETANKMLGREFKLTGVVIKGKQLGRKIGFPTANIVYPKTLVELPYGVYSVGVNTDGKNYKAIMNYGIKPTVDSSNLPIVETHICSFNEDIYGKEIEISVKKMIRQEQRFESIEELKKQIEKDLESC